MKKWRDLFLYPSFLFPSNFVNLRKEILSYFFVGGPVLVNYDNYRSCLTDNINWIMSSKQTSKYTVTWRYHCGWCQIINRHCNCCSFERSFSDWKKNEDMRSPNFFIFCSQGIWSVLSWVAPKFFKNMINLKSRCFVLASSPLISFHVLKKFLLPIKYYQSNKMCWRCEVFKMSSS